MNMKEGYKLIMKERQITWINNYMFQNKVLFTFTQNKACAGQINVHITTANLSSLSNQMLL